jgi:peptide/nickel transport system permease protein
VRVRNSLTVLVKSRLALSGLIILTMFIVAAAFAPQVTPYRPVQKVSSLLAQPAWVTYIYGDVGFSQNTNFGGINASTNATGMSLRSVPRPPDGVDLLVNSTTGGTILVVETLHDPYRGAPVEFTGTAGITPSGVSNTTRASWSVSIERPDINQRSVIFSENLTTTNEYHQTFRSNDQGIAARLGYPIGQVNLAEVLFSHSADYRYVLTITLPKGSFQGGFQVRNFKMDLFGNTWGLLGTDDEGNDVFTQLVYGARLSLLVGLVAAFLGIGLGLIVGLMAGYLGKLVDEVLMRFTDMMLVVPGLPLLIVLAAVLGSSLLNIIIILGFLGWMGFARLVRSQVLSLRERPFIEAAKASGAGTGYILGRHIFPNIVGLTYVNLALSVPAAIVGEAALSFLGLGDPTQITWGRMLDLFRESGATSSWWWIVPPGVGISLLSLAFILVGYSLDELFNPRLRRRR